MQMYLEILGMVTLMGDFQAWPESVPWGPYHGEGDETETHQG